MINTIINLKRVNFEMCIQSLCLYNQRIMDILDNHWLQRYVYQRMIGYSMSSEYKVIGMYK